MTAGSSVDAEVSVDSVGARAAVGLVLPSYMVPDVVVVVASSRCRVRGSWIGKRCRSLFSVCGCFGRLVLLRS